MSQKSSCFAAAWDLAPCPHSQFLFRYVLLMPTKFSCLAAAWELAPCPHFQYLPNDLLHHQAGDRKGKVSNFRWLQDRKIGSGILSSSAGVVLKVPDELFLCSLLLQRPLSSYNGCQPLLHNWTLIGLGEEENLKKLNRACLAFWSSLLLGSALNYQPLL